jgi:hypothetical protein
MKGIARYLVGAIVMLFVSAVCFVAGLLDRDIAHAQEHIVEGDYGEPQQTFQDAERYYGYASRLPWVGNGPVNELRARQAALQYWQKRYTAIVPEVGDPIANTPADNIDLQFLVSNAMYREGLAQATDKARTLAALDAAINAYAAVLKNAVRHDDAAYNYEYVVKLRADVAKERRKIQLPPQVAEPAGQLGHPLQAGSGGAFKVYVPFDKRELEKDTTGKAGKGPPLRKKG